MIPAPVLDAEGKTTFSLATIGWAQKQVVR